MVDGGVLAGFGFPANAGQEVPLFQGKGCRQCRNTGYLGRCGIFEIFPMSDQLQTMTGSLAAEADIRRIAVQEGMTSLKDDVWRKMLEGVTTCEEAVRVVGG